MKVVLGHEHDLVGEGLKTTLRRLCADATIVEAASLCDVLAALGTNADVNLLILDLGMPALRSPRALELIHARHPAVPIVLLPASAVGDIDEAAGSKLGVLGFIRRSFSISQTLAALRHALRGEIFLPEPEGRTPALPAQVSRLPALSPREREVLRLLCEGCSNKEIARRLALREVTVKAHLGQVFRKLGVSSRTQAVKLALQAGWGDQ